MTNEQALQELNKLKEASTAFYESPAGVAQLKWLDDFEANLMNQAITGNDSTMRLSCLDQAKGLRVFRAYLVTLTAKD